MKIRSKVGISPLILNTVFAGYSNGIAGLNEQAYRESPVAIKEV